MLATLKGKLPLIVAGVAVVLAVGVTTYFVGVLPFSPKPEAVHAKEAGTEPPAAPKPQHTLKEMVINLADPGGRRYVKLGVTLEVNWGGAELQKASAEERKKKQAEFDEALTPWLPAINDAIINIVSARSVSDLSTPEGKQRLKADIKEELNRLLGADQVANVLFTQFVMQ